MLTRLTLLVVIACQCIAATAQDDFTTYFITPELRINFNEPPIEIRYRPHDYYAPWGVHRTEIMAGGVFWKGTLKVFSHTRLDNGAFSNRRVRASSGIRIDFNTKTMIAKKPLLINVQWRQFVPLNENGPYQWVFVQDNSYILNDRIWPSLLGFMTANRTSDTEWGQPNWWLGPGVVIHLNKNLNTYLCYLPDILQRNKPYVFLRLQFKLKA